jgi:hypothetical protein
MDSKIKYEEQQEAISAIKIMTEKIISCLESLTPDNPDLFMESFETLYLESVESEAQKVLVFIKNIIIHLFKSKYGNDVNSRNHLRKEIENFREEINDITDYDTNKPKATVVNKANREIDKSYGRAVRSFRKILEDPYDSKDYSIKANFINKLPESCPWNFQEIMDDSIDSLLSILPSIK